jgi:tRNA (guanine-N7-)-methyltransferase
MTQPVDPTVDRAVVRARSVRSYVTRAGRITAAQQRALEELWPRFGVDFGPATLDLDRLFGRSAPRTLEIGFGNGEHLLERAAAEPQGDFLGIEVHRPGVGHLLLGAARASIGNLRVLAHDAVEVLEVQIPPSSLDALQLLFPDPWPKKRHQKRRIVSPSFVALAVSRLKTGARLHLATDWEPYALQMREVLDCCNALGNCAPGGGFLESGLARTATRFERRGERLGHRVHELLYERR